MPRMFFFYISTQILVIISEVKSDIKRHQWWITLQIFLSEYWVHLKLLNSWPAVDLGSHWWWISQEVCLADVRGNSSRFFSLSKWLVLFSQGNNPAFDGDSRRKHSGARSFYHVVTSSLARPRGQFLQFWVFKKLHSGWERIVTCDMFEYVTLVAEKSKWNFVLKYSDK